MGNNLGRLALITVLVFAAMSAAQPALFFTRANFSSMAFQFPEFALLGLAVMVSMLTGGIDLSVIGLANLSSMLAVLVMRRLAPDAHASDALPAIILGIATLLATGAFGGLLNGLAIAGIGIPPILATLGTGLIFTGIAVVLSGGAAVLGFPDAISVLGNGALFGVPVPVLLFVRPRRDSRFHPQLDTFWPAGISPRLQCGRRSLCRDRQFQRHASCVPDQRFTGSRGGIDHCGPRQLGEG